MLSYRHHYHAGNHADVLKHWLLATVLTYLNQKDKPYCYVDTHSGAGGYRLDTTEATKLNEFSEGIDKLMQASVNSPSLQAFCDLIEQNGYNDSHRRYPGSPKIAQLLTRDADILRLFELHTADFTKLKSMMQKDRRVQVNHTDGFGGLKALLPPASRRGLIMVDPAYEVKSEYSKVLSVLQDSCNRFATGVYLVWYPLLNRVENIQFRERLEKIRYAKWGNFQLETDTEGERSGMYGSGVFVINPPWVLQQEAPAVLPELAALLSDNGSGRYHINFSEGV